VPQFRPVYELVKFKSFHIKRLSFQKVACPLLLYVNKTEKNKKTNKHLAKECEKWQKK